MDSIYTTDIAVASTPGADVNAVTLVYMCHLFGFMKEWLQEGGMSTDSAIASDSDTIVQRENMFSDADCDDYYYKRYKDSTCQDNSMWYETDPEDLEEFAKCITRHFMTEMGASKSCSGDSVRSDINTMVKNTTTLLSKDGLFYNFLVGTLNAGNICQATNDGSNVTFSSHNCNWYTKLMRHGGSKKCTYDTPRADSDRQSYSDCLGYRFLKSLGFDDSVCKDWTLVYTCSMFGFMKDLLQEGGISTDRAIVSGSDTIVQRVNMFSYLDCKYYHLLKRGTRYSVCEDNSLLYETDPEDLEEFAKCITHHFMTEMGASKSCSGDSVRSDINTIVKNTTTLISKDGLFYNFLVDTLNAGNICQATNDGSNVTFSSRKCYWYTKLMRHGGNKKCTYDTPGVDSDRQSYSDCLGYRFLKSLGFDDSVCKDWTLVYMCSMFGFMKDLLQEGGISTDRAIVSGSDIIVQRENMSSYFPCTLYHIWKHDTITIANCEDNSLLRVTYPGDILGFTLCITLHFITEMGVTDNCFDNSVRSNINTTVQNSKILLSKDLHFHNFMVDTLNAGNICPAVNNTVTLPADKCQSYIIMVKDRHYESRCGYNRQRTDINSELLYSNIQGNTDIYQCCLEYRLMKSLGADSVCQLSLIDNCDWYYNIVQSLAPTCICVFGLIGNLLSLCMFGSGATETPIAYQLLWLAGVDVTFILTWWVVEVLPHILHYYNDEYYLTPYQTSVVSVLTVCLRPLSYVTRSCTVWLTVLIGLYRYLVVCHPYNNLTSHCTQHGHKYVILVVFLSFLYNIPYFCDYYLGYKYAKYRYVYDNYDWRQADNYVDGWNGFYTLNRTGLVSKESLLIFSRIHAAVIVSLPCLVLIFVTVSILVELRKLKKKRSSMQTSQTSQNHITVMLVTILIASIICQLPYFVWFGFGGEIRNPDLDNFLSHEKRKIQGCGNFMYYISRLVDAGLLLNSSANGFIYFFVNKTFREALFSRCPCRRDEGIETIEMGPVTTRRTQDDTHP